MTESSPKKPSRAPSPARRPSPLAALGYMLFVVIGGTLIFSFAWALGPAVQKQAGAACRSLDPAPRSGEAPEFPFVHRDGTEDTLSNLRGRFVVLNFWASWCEPCVQEWPELDRLAHRFEDRDDLVVMAVSLDESLAEVETFLGKMESIDTSVLVVHDPTKESNRLFGSEKLPDTFFINREGQLASAFINQRRWGSQGAVLCLEHELAQ